MLWVIGIIGLIVLFVALVDKQHSIDQEDSDWNN